MRNAIWGSLWMSYQTWHSLYRISWLLWLLSNDGCDLKAKGSLLRTCAPKLREIMKLGGKSTILKSESIPWLEIGITFQLCLQQQITDQICVQSSYYSIYYFLSAINLFLTSCPTCSAAPFQLSVY